MKNLKSVNPKSKNEGTLPPLTLGPENSIKGEKKTDKIYFRDIRQNNKSGVYTNIKSRTPKDKPTIQEYYQTKYLFIEYNEMFKSFLNNFLSRFDEEYYNILSEDYLITDLIMNFESQGFIKCKVDLQNYNDSFFSTFDDQKKRRNLNNYDCNFLFDKITSGVYSIKICGLWRKEEKVNNRAVTVNSGLTIKVLGVIVNGYSTDEDESDNYEDGILAELQSSAVDMYDEED